MTSGTYNAPQPIDPAQQQPKKSGCLTAFLVGCGVLFVLGIGFVAVIVFVVFAAIKSSDVYKGAMSRVKSDPRVIAVLGSPIEEGWLVMGSVKIDNGEGRANIDFPISGPKGRAGVHAEATLGRDGWKYSVLTVKPRGGPIIDLAASQ